MFCENAQGAIVATLKHSHSKHAEADYLFCFVEMPWEPLLHCYNTHSKRPTPGNTFYGNKLSLDVAC